MVQLKILTGKQAGAVWVARRFPVRVGREPGADLQVDEQGVWDRHVELSFRPGHGVVLMPQPEALTRVNGERIETAVLRNGDMIELGGARLQFWLSETRQRGLRWREWLTWAAIGLMSIGQVALIYLLQQ